MSDLKTEHTSRQVIENRLLAALETDRSKVAILCSEDDLETIIYGLSLLMEDRMLSRFKRRSIQEFINGLQQLKRGAFGP